MRIPIWISNRHIHLSEDDAKKLFWDGYEMKILKKLSQPGQFACEEVVTLKWDRWEISKVRILGPYRKHTQVEIMMSDCFKLWVNAPIRESGDLKKSASLEIIGPKGSFKLITGVIVAKRHLHITKVEADEFGIKDSQIIKVKTEGERGLVFDNVVVRVRDDFALDCHIDMEEANAAGLKPGDWGVIVK